MPPETPSTTRRPESRNRLLVGLGRGLVVAGGRIGVLVGRWKVILPAAISSRAIDSGLRDTDGTWGGTMAPRPSPSWLK